MKILPLTPARQKGDVEDVVGYSTDGATTTAGTLPSPEHTQKGDSGTGEPSSSPECFPYPLTARKRRIGRVARRSPSPIRSASATRHENGHRPLDAWIQRSQPDTHSAPSTVEDHNVDIGRSSNISAHNGVEAEPLFVGLEMEHTRPRDFVSARSLPTGTPLNDIPSVAQRQPRRAGLKKQRNQAVGINKPYISPVNDPNKVWFDVGSSQGQGRRSAPKRRSREGDHWDQSVMITNDEFESPGNGALGHLHPDLAVTLDYETRKADAMQQRKALRQKPASLPADLAHFSGQADPKANSPHTNRYNKAVAALSGTEASTTNPTDSMKTLPVFESDDARGYLIRLQSRSQTSGTRSERERSISLARARSGTSIRRRKTVMLPLESISEDSTTRDLEVVLEKQDMGTIKMASRVKSLKDVDGYLGGGRIDRGLEEGRTINVVRSWEDQLRLMVKKYLQVR